MTRNTLTVGQLKKILENLPDHVEIHYEYDGPETFSEVEALDYVIYEDRIILVGSVLGQS